MVMGFARAPLGVLSAIQYFMAAGRSFLFIKAGWLEIQLWLEELDN